MDIRSGKKALRAEMKKIIADLPEEEIRRQSIAACMRAAQCSQFINAETVLVYSAVKGEIDPVLLAEIARGMGKQVAYPRCEGEELGLYIAKDGHFVPGVFGIPEPDDTCRRIGVDQVDFAVVPGLAFDRQGGRLGRGKGYYDRLLENTAAVKAALSFNEQLTEYVPMEEHDSRMDMIITEKWDILLTK